MINNQWTQASRFYILISVVFLGLRLATSGFFWDNTVKIYSEFFEESELLNHAQTQVSNSEKVPNTFFNKS